MEVTTTALAGVLIVQPKVFADARGFFLESFNQRQFDAAVGAPVTFVQDNHSRSARGVLRGLHMQVGAHAQGKLVRVTAGNVFDVAVDIREGSATFGRWIGIELSAVNHKQIWIPAGFAHGFLVISDAAEVQYKATDYYAPNAEACIRWDDPQLAIPWPLGATTPVLSKKDADAPLMHAR